MMVTAVPSCALRASATNSLTGSGASPGRPRKNFTLSFVVALPTTGISLIGFNARVSSS